MSFQKKIKELRERKDWTQEELAKKINVSQAAIAQYETGRKIPTIIVGVKLAQVLNTTCEELVSD